jgi:DNA-binding response OmpR family regulator
MNVLVVDDDVDTTALLAMLLERRGHHVDVASTLTEAKAALDVGDHDVLVADLHLPDGNGTSLLDPVRPSSLRLALLVTGASEEEQQEASHDLGFDGCYTKPVDGRQIVQRVQALTNNTGSSP